MSTTLTYKDAITDIDAILESQASVLDKEISECENTLIFQALLNKNIIVF